MPDWQTTYLFELQVNAAKALEQAKTAQTGLSKILGDVTWSTKDLDVAERRLIGNMEAASKRMATYITRWNGITATILQAQKAFDHFNTSVLHTFTLMSEQDPFGLLLEEAEEMSEKMVDHSIIPDMVNKIIKHLQRVKIESAGIFDPVRASAEDLWESLPLITQQGIERVMAASKAAAISGGLTAGRTALVGTLAQVRTLKQYEAEQAAWVAQRTPPGQLVGVSGGIVSALGRKMQPW